MEFIKDLCTKEIEIMNKNITEKQMHLIAKYNNILKISNYRQKGFFVDYIRSNYGANIFILKYLLDEIKDYGYHLIRKQNKKYF